MKPNTSEWVAKAEGDFLTACRELQVREKPNYDAVCFHAHQSIEKYLKAKLIEEGSSFPKVHDLSALLTLNLLYEPSWENLREDLEQLTDIGIEVRYPGISADEEDAKESLRISEKMRNIVRFSLNLKPD